MYSLGRIFRARPGSVRQWLRYSTPFLSRGYKSKEMKPIDEGLSLGDYPQLPWISAQELPPTGWWDNQDRRNKEDPLHEQDDILSMWVCDHVENNGRYTRFEGLCQMMAMFSLLGVIFGLSILYDAPSRNPCVPRQFPYNNLYLSRGGDPKASPDGDPVLVPACRGEMLV